MSQERETAALTPEDVTFNEQGLVPCIVQDVDTMKVLMMAWMNEESLRLTIEQRTTWFYSRSRQKLWHKGEESGNTQELVALQYDCDADTLLALVRPKGPACHTGNETCFYRSFDVAQPLQNSQDVAQTPASSIQERGLTVTLGITTVQESSECVRMDLPVTPAVMQPVGFLHGGATITLLESCASKASWLGSDLEGEYSFGSHIDIKHVNAVREGWLHGVATLDQVEDLGSRGRKEYWHVEATDDAGKLVSTGTVVTRVVSKEFYANR